MARKKINKGGAPLGNKNAVGYGRPPNDGFEDDDLIRLGEELLEWCKQIDKEKKVIVHLSEWYSEIKGISPTQWLSLSKRSCFKCYYDRAMRWMGKQILKNNKMPSAYGSRFLGIYFNETADFEKEIVEHKIDYEIKKKAEAAMRNPEISDEVKSFIGQIFAFRASPEENKVKIRNPLGLPQGKGLPRRKTRKSQS